MANLTPAELRKYNWRSELFVKKLRDQTPFTLKTGESINLTYSSELENTLLFGNNLELSKLRIDGVKISDIVKTEEFGGKPSGHFLMKENYALNKLNSSIQEAKTLLDRSFVPIYVQNTYFEVSYAESTPGTPKSDFHLVCPKGNEVIWISHKDGSTAKCFQQWGGISEKHEPNVFNHAETQQFINDLKNLYPQGVPRATTVCRKINDPHLKKLSVYGNDYSGVNGRQNVTLTIQGNILLERKEFYCISGDKIHHNGSEMLGDYEPSFIATYRGDRSNGGIPQTRISIAPIGGRKVSMFI